MLEFYLSSLIMLLVVMDPIGISPIFAALTQDESETERRKIAIRSVAVASFLLFVFAIGGHSLLSYLGISLDAFRVTGGILLFLLSQIASSKLCTLVQGFSCYSLCYSVVYGRTKTQWTYDYKLNGSFGLGHEI